MAGPVNNWTNTSPKYNTWNDVPPAERNFISGLVDQWLGLIGYTIDVPQWALAEMAQNGVSSLSGIGDYMWHHIYGGPGYNPGAYFVPPQAVLQSPGARFGLNKDEFQSRLTSYQTVMQELTGTGGNFDQLSSMLAANGGNLDQAWVREQVMHDASMQNQYGWLKYGMDYDQFQQQKTQWRAIFGRDLSNQEAVQQLGVLHQAQGRDASVTAALTFSQQEKKAAYVGPSANVVR